MTSPQHSAERLYYAAKYLESDDARGLSSKDFWMLAVLTDIAESLREFADK